MERCQTGVISSIIVVFCYFTDTTFIPIPTFGDQLICKASQEEYWDFFASEEGQCQVKLSFFQHALIFLFVLFPFHSFQILLSSSSAASAHLIRVSLFLLCPCPDTTNSLYLSHSFLFCLLYLSNPVAFESYSHCNV